MDISNIHPIVSGTSQTFKVPPPQTASSDQVPDTTVKQSEQQIVSAHNDNTLAQSSAAAQAQYQEALRQTYMSLQNFHPLGDTEFTIFKDATGQLITRYVSLTDGSVTYVPAPPALMKKLAPELPTQVTIQA